MNSLDDIEDKPFVACLSHTCFWEFLLWILYRYSSCTLNKYPPVLLMGANLVKKFSWITRKMNCIGIEKGPGNFDKVIRKINKRKTRIVILDPSGDATKAAPWKSGYYYIAQKLQWDLRSIGFDFERKELHISKAISWRKSKEEIETFLQKEMQEFVPYIPRNSYVPVRKHNKHNISVMSQEARWVWSVILILIIFLIILVLLTSPPLKNDQQ